MCISTSVTCWSLFQVLESKVAIEEGLVPEKLNGLVKTITSEDLGN